MKPSSKVKSRSLVVAFISPIFCIGVVIIVEYCFGIVRSIRCGRTCYVHVSSLVLGVLFMGVSEDEHECGTTCNS